MNTVVSVALVPGVSKTSGKPFTRYDATLDNGVTASGFTPVVVGEKVDVIQQGKYINYLKVGQTAPMPVANPPQQRNVAGGMSKDDYWTRKEQRDIEGVSRMGRAHSQEMALRYFAILGGVPGAKTQTEITDKLRAMIDFFERDIEYSQTGEEPQYE